MRDELIPYRVRTTGPRLEDVFALQRKESTTAGARTKNACAHFTGRGFLLSDLAPCPKKVTGDLSFQTGERLIEPFRDRARWPIRLAFRQDFHLGLKRANHTRNVMFALRSSMPISNVILQCRETPRCHKLA